MAVISFIGAPIAAYYSAKVSDAKEKAGLSDRITALETAIPYIIDKVDETNEDVKDIKRALNIK